jgi:hypothetical protein
MIGTGQTFTTLAAAWTYAQNAKIADGGYLHFYISSVNGNFTEAFTAPFLLDNQGGARMALIGDSTSNDILQFNGTNGLIVDKGHSFNTLSNLTLEDKPRLNPAPMLDSRPTTMHRSPPFPG